MSHRWRALLLLAVLTSPLLLAACGRANWPKPPGPPDQIIYPRTYPSR